MNLQFPSVYESSASCGDCIDAVDCIVLQESFLIAAVEECLTMFSVLMHPSITSLDLQHVLFHQLSREMITVG